MFCLKKKTSYQKKSILTIINKILNKKMIV